MSNIQDMNNKMNIDTMTRSESHTQKISKMLNTDRMHISNTLTNALETGKYLILFSSDGKLANYKNLIKKSSEEMKKFLNNAGFIIFNRNEFLSHLLSKEYPNTKNGIKRAKDYVCWDTFNKNVSCNCKRFAKGKKQDEHNITNSKRCPNCLD